MSQDETKTCSICLECLNKPIQLPCQHEFCAACLEGWRSKYGTPSTSSKNKSCPLCRKKIPPSKEMIMQFKATNQLLQLAQSALDQYPEKPLPIHFLAERGDSFMSMFQMLPFEQQQETIKGDVCRQIEFCQRDLIKLEEDIFGDCTNSEERDLLQVQLLQDGEKAHLSSEETTELPMEMVKAAANNNIKKVLEWLGPKPIPKHRLDAKCSEKMDRTLLHEAEFAGRVGLMSILLQEGADVDPQSCYGTTPLAQACINNGLDHVAGLLLEWGAVNDSDNNEVESLARSAERTGNKRLAKLLRTPLGGRRCEIHGLESRTDLNGLTCVAVRYLPKQARYAIKVEWTGEMVSIAPSNLKRRDRTPTDPGMMYFFHGTTPDGGNAIQSGVCLAEHENKEDYDAAIQSYKQKQEQSRAGE